MLNFNDEERMFSYIYTNSNDSINVGYYSASYVESISKPRVRLDENL